MVRIALDPTPFHHSHSLLEIPRVAAECGFEWLQLTPHADMIPFFNHPKADDDLVKAFAKAAKDAGVGIASTLPVLRWSGPDEDAAHEITACESPRVPLISRGALGVVAGVTETLTDSAGTLLDGCAFRKQGPCQHR